VRLYVDSSAFLKLLVREPGSTALQAYIRGTTLLTSFLTPIEVERAIRRHGLQDAVNIDALFAGVELRQLDSSVVTRGGNVRPPALGTIAAIHLATALELRAELDAFVTYDTRLAEAARSHRLPVVAPA
jgi:uncharacterized protein